MQDNTFSWISSIKFKVVLHFISFGKDFCVPFFMIVQFQKVSMLPPQKGMEFPGGRGFELDPKIEEMHEA